MRVIVQRAKEASVSIDKKIVEVNIINFRDYTLDPHGKVDSAPFGGGAGAGVSLSPTAFLVIQGDLVKLLPVNHSTSLDKLLDYIPDLFEKVNTMMNKSMKNKKEQTDKIISTIQKKCKKEDESFEKVKETKIEDIENEELEYDNYFEDEFDEDD